jgi:hypothetical protein
MHLVIIKMLVHFCVGMILVNEENFCTAISPSLWYFPRNVSEGESDLLVMGDVRLPNSKVRCMMASINAVIGATITDRPRTFMVKDCLARYKFAIHIVTCPQEYINLELASFQEESNVYGKWWIRVCVA